MIRARYFRSFSIVLAAAFSLACSGGDDDANDSAGLATVFDSTHRDSVIARTAGIVPSMAVRRVVDHMRIAPTADDTSLFGEVREFDVGRDGRLYVFDDAAHLLFLFDSAGTLVRRVGRKGAGPGEFNSNNGMVVLRDGRLAQFDANNGRLSFLTADGEFENAWIVTTGFYTSNGIRTDTSGALFLARPVTEPREGEVLGRFGLVRLPASGVFGDSLVPPDLPVNRVVYVARNDGSTSASGAAHSARFLWTWHPQGYFVSANGGAYEIELGRPTRPVRIVRDAPQIPISAEEQAFEQERITDQMRYTQPGWIWNGPTVTSKAPVVGLSVTRDGRIWAQVATPSEEIPVAEREAERPGYGLVARYRQALEFEIFGPDGRFVGRVQLPRGSQLMEADGNDVWYLARDGDGLPAVVRARIEPAFR